jgi:hypothetical protein
MAVNEVPTKSIPLSSFTNPTEGFSKQASSCCSSSRKKRDIMRRFKLSVPCDVEYRYLAISHTLKMHPRKINTAPTSCDVANDDMDVSGELPLLSLT